MKKILSLIVIVALLGSMSLFAAGDKEAAPSSVKIGFIGPMTGDYSNYGDLISKGALVAIEEKNAKGGIAGKIKIDFVIEDSEGDPQKGLAGIEKLSSSDKITALIGPVFTGVAFAVGNNTALGTMLAGFLFGILKNAQALMQGKQIPKEITFIIQGLIVVFIALRSAIAIYLAWRNKRDLQKEVLAK
jgi:hypothetical protein